MKKITAVLALLSVITYSSASHASLIIETGFDLFDTNPWGSSFDFGGSIGTVNFEGNPLGTFDFGSGAVSVGTTDTIVERTQAANLAPHCDPMVEICPPPTCNPMVEVCNTIEIEMAALSLISVNEVDLGFGSGLEDVLVTLNTSSPSVQSWMTIYDGGEGSPHGTFDSLLNFTFDVSGSIGGHYLTLEKTFTSTGSEWQHNPTGEVLITGVNYRLNGSDVSEDFHLFGSAFHDTGGGQHTVKPVPAPATITLFSLGLAGLGWSRRKKA